MCLDTLVNTTKITDPWIFPSISSNGIRSSECHKYISESNTWENFTSLSKPRSHYGLVQISEDSFWITGKLCNLMIDTLLSFYFNPTEVIQIFVICVFFVRSQITLKFHTFQFVTFSKKGGSDGSTLQDSEVYSGGSFHAGPDLPYPVDRHCMVKINDTHVMTTGMSV